MKDKVNIGSKNYDFSLESYKAKGVKVAFVIGHTELSSGKFSKYLGNSEWDFWLEYAEEYLDGMGDIFIHDRDNDSYTSRQTEMATRTKGYDLAIELHFNGFDGEANGCECLYYANNEVTKKVAQHFSDLCHERMGYKNRGAKKKSKTDRGGKFLYLQKPSALLTECFFGDHKKDCNRFDKLKFKQIIEETIEYFGHLKKI